MARQKRTISILLAEDHQVVRQGLRALLEAEADFSVVGEATNGIQALRLAKRIRPRVLILDLMMPGLNGFEVIGRLAKKYPRIRIVILSMHANQAYVELALRKGAIAYVLKDCAAAELVHAIRFAAVGRHYLSPPLSERPVEFYLRNPEEPAEPYEALTDREREVLLLAAEGRTTSDIAFRLAISPRTVETHRYNLRRKLKLRSPSELIRFALAKGLLRRHGE